MFDFNNYIFQLFVSQHVLMATVLLPTIAGEVSEYISI